MNAMRAVSESGICQVEYSGTEARQRRNSLLEVYIHVGRMVEVCVIYQKNEMAGDRGLTCRLVHSVIYRL